MEETKKLEDYLEGKKVDDFYVKPHKKKSREVTEKDVERLLKDAKVMLALCYESRGNFPSAYAIAHAQINSKDPLRFYVTYEGDIIVNPEIIRHSNYTVKKKEGCYSIPELGLIEVDRWHKLEVECQTIEYDKLTEKRVLKFSGRDAEIVQHECDHLNGKYIINI